MDAQENTREGRDETPAGSASRGFQVNDPVIAKVGDKFVRCTIARVVDTGYFAIDCGGMRAYRFANELAPIEDAPADVVAAAQDTPSRAG